MSSKQSGIYAIVNTVNGKVYVGSTIDLHRRRLHHQWELRANTHRNGHLQAAYNLHGSACFEFRLLESVDDPAQLTEREHAWMTELRSCERPHGYNLMRFAHRPQHAPETRAKMSAAHKAKPFTPEHRAAVSAALVVSNKRRAGQKLSAERRAQLSAQGKGRRNSPEAYERAAAKRRGVKTGPLSPEHRAKIGAKSKGRTHSAQTRARMSDIARHRSTETLQKQSESHGTLIASQVRAIRQRISQGEGVSALAREYGVRQPTISDIKSRRTWKHLP